MAGGRKTGAQGDDDLPVPLRRLIVAGLRRPLGTTQMPGRIITFLDRRGDAEPRTMLRHESASGR